jgi:hypothetical protein
MISPTNKIKLLNFRNILMNFSEEVYIQIKFEYNDQITRNIIVDSYINLMNSLKIEKYQIICNESNNQPNVVDDGGVIIDIILYILGNEFKYKIEFNNGIIVYGENIYFIDHGDLPISKVKQYVNDMMMDKNPVDEI